MELKDMVEKQLKENGFDTLFRPESCACNLSNLMPCNQPHSDCKGGFSGKVSLTSEDMEKVITYSEEN